MYRQPHLIEPCTISTEHYKTDSNTLCYARIYSCAITIISVGRGERFQIPELFRVSNLKHTEVVTFLHIFAVLQKKLNKISNFFRQFEDIRGEAAQMARVLTQVEITWSKIRF